jgi:hypothetical protein
VKFRVTDERVWTREFHAHDAAGLARGITAAWDVRIETARRTQSATHPAFALVARLAEVDRWLMERMTRADSTNEQRRSWESQAWHWRYTARTELGGDTSSSPLRLHIWAPGDEGVVSVWCTLAARTPSGSWGCDPHAPRVSRVDTAARIAELWTGAVRMVEHARALAGLADGIPEMLRVATHPRPILVSAETDTESLS